MTTTIESNANVGNYTKVFSKNTQYTQEVISMFENTFGKHHMSAGGEDMSNMMAKVLEPLLTSGSCRMLDVGFGIGGAAFEFSEKYGADVVGIDVNDVGVEMACREVEKRDEQRVANGQEKLKLNFKVLDAVAAEFDAESFDVIYSRDALLHLGAESKKKLFDNFHKWLAPGGMVCIADYCLGRNSFESGLPTEGFTAYLNARGYHMWTPEVYAKHVAEAGFEDAHGEDLGLWYCVTCQREVDRVLLPGPSQDEFMKTHTEEERAKLEKTYRDKIQMTLRGDRSYVLVTAKKCEPYMKLRKEVSDAYKKLYKDGYIMSCDGNISARIDGGESGMFLVTPSGVDVPDLEPSKIVLCDSNGKSAEPISKFKPSSETGLHTLIYQTRPDVGAIVHAHSIYTCAIACCRIPLPPAHYAVCELIHDTSASVPKTVEETMVLCAPYHTYGTWPLAVATSACLGKNYAVFMANHGAIVVGKDLEEAMYLSDRLERECEIYYRSLQLGTPKNLTAQEINALHRRDRSYGQDAKEEDTQVTDINTEPKSDA